MSERKWLQVDNLCSDEQFKTWKDHFNPPPMVNDLGSLRVMVDPMGIQDLMFPPFSGKNEGTGMLYINRRHPASESVKVGFTWYPDRVRRRSEIDGFKIEAISRAAAADRAALVLLNITNPGSEKRQLEVGIKIAGRLIHTIDGWASIGPHIHHNLEHPEKWSYHSDLGGMIFSSQPKAFSAQGTRPLPGAVEGKTLIYNISLDPGKTWMLKFVLALGESEDEAAGLFSSLIDDFDGQCRKTRDRWQDKINSAFTPGNSFYSGSLPYLQTENDDISRLYYMSFMGSLLCRRDNPLSTYGPTFITLLPNYWTTATFLWDWMIAGPYYALLDPALHRNILEVWLQMDLSKYLATDYVTGKGLGNWYAVNNPAMVRLANDYLRYTGDFAWLRKEVGGRKVIDGLEEHALAWHTLDKHGHGLADCGSVDNLLECVSTYVHEVAGFNAMWVAALRSVAAFRRIIGDEARAAELEKDAAGLLKNTLSLYADGKGYWRCKQPDGSFNDVRHIYDLIAVLESISGDLPDKIKKEMVDYFQREHQTECWMRGLSSWDDDVYRSFRVDLQWTGSYPSLPAQVMNGLYNIGRNDVALPWLEKIAPIALQGPLGQGHWVEGVVPPYKGGPYKCAPHFPYGTDWTVASNGAWPAMFIESIFGARATLTDGLQWRDLWGSFDPDARLEGLRYQGALYDITKNGPEKK